MIWAILAIGGLIVASIVAWGWASQATASATVGLIETFVKNWLYISSFVLLVLFGIIIIIRLAKGEIDKKSSFKYTAIMLVLGLFTVFGIPFIQGIILDTYKVKVKTEICNQLSGPIHITNVWIDQNSWEKQTSLSLYTWYYKPVSWFDDSFVINYHVICYLYGKKVYENIYSTGFIVKELLCETHEQWLYNLPPGSSCKLEVWLSGSDEVNPLDIKVINFVVPK